MVTNAFLVGEHVCLRPFEHDDTNDVRRWYNDHELRGLIGVMGPFSASRAEEWFEEICKDEQRLWFAIALKGDGRVIGECGLLRMCPAWGTTDLSIIIGERGAQGQGYGTEAARMLLDHAFGYLRFHRVAIGVVAFNERALRFYERVGFRREGLQRDGYYFNHEYHDFVMLSLLEDEFRASVSD